MPRRAGLAILKAVAAEWNSRAPAAKSPGPRRNFAVVVGGAQQSIEHVASFGMRWASAVQLTSRPVAKRVSRAGAVVIGVLGKPEENDTTVFGAAIASLLPQPPPGAPGPYALSADGGLEALALQAGMTPVIVETVQCPFDYPDEKTALRGMLSSGPFIRAMQVVGEETVRNVILETIAPFRTASGGYYLKNSFRYLLAKAG